MSIYRSALARAPRRIIFPATSRAYANASTDVGPKGTHESPPLPPPGSKPELSIDPTRGGVNTLVWVGALTAAAGGAYWYSTTSKGATEKEKAEARAREMKAKADTKGNELRVGHLLSSIFILYRLSSALMAPVLITLPLSRARQLRNTTLRKPKPNRNIKGQRLMHRRSMSRARVLLLTSTKRQRVKWHRRMTQPRFASNNLSRIFPLA